MINRIFSKTSVNKELVTAYSDTLLSLKCTPDLIIPTCIPFESVVAALNYKKRFPGTVVMPVLFDLFSENNNLNYFKFIRKIKWKANLSLEKQMLEQSKAVFFVENWRKHLDIYFHQYNEKLVQIEHPLLIKPSSINCNMGNHDKKVHIVYTGVIDKKNKNPEPVLQILDRLSSNSFVFDFYGYGSAENIISNFSENHPQFIFHGKVDTKTAEMMRHHADVLLSIGNSDYSQMPSKLIEYIASGKLIVHFSIDDNDPAIKLLDQYQNKIIVNLSREVETDRLEKEILLKYKDQIPFSTVVQIYRCAAPEYIANQLKIRGGYRLIFAGALKSNYVEADEILKIFAFPILENCKIRFYSSGTGTKAVEICNQNNIELYGWINRDELEKEYRKADVLISIAEKTGRQMSSKIFDYMSFGKPIIHFYFAEDDVNVPWLNRYNNSLCVKITDGNYSDISNELALFILSRSGTIDYNCFNDSILSKCTPDYIAGIISSNF